MPDHVWTQEEQREHRRLWVEALRSGKYEQTTGMLRDNGNYCCLGVACDISKLGEWIDDDEYQVRGERAYDNVLPNEVRNWLGLADDGGGFDSPDDINSALWRSNDNGASFSLIADIIESEPPGLLASPDTAALS